MAMLRNLRSSLVALLLFLAAPMMFALGHPPSDFFGNGTSDLLWRNGTTGQVYMMPMGGGQVEPGAVIWTEPNMAWQIVGTGDFDGDGKADILWWNSSTGQVCLMLMNGSVVKSSSIIYTEPNTAWTIQAVADFTGDGKADILWRNSTTGQVYLMPMNGSTVLAGAVIWTEPDPAWQIVAAADFDGDGKADILWWNSTTGQVCLMLMNSNGVKSSSIIYTEPNTAWQIVGTGDFNGDGKTDILWRNNSMGQVYVMVMNGTSVLSGAVIWTESDMAWQISAIGDFNGDGKSDIVWRHSITGQVFEMLMNGLNISSSGVIYTEPNTAWTLQAKIHPMVYSIVGTWVFDEMSTNNQIEIFTYLPNGTALEAVYAPTYSGDPTEGIQEASYSWNISSGALNLSNLVVDTSNDWGFYNLVSGATTLIWKPTGTSSSTVTHTPDPAMAVPRLVTTAEPLVGTWLIYGAMHGNLIGEMVFLPSGYYFFIVLGGDENVVGNVGLDFGTYSLNAGSGILSVNTLVSKTGGWGLPAGNIPVPIALEGTTFVLNGDAVNAVFHRLEP